eukprot:CAMPEP_0172092490 /NCGR_PEP_ID=MMETSP1043-20130122/25467_1 /TAXON_ID=464988 /ORGANISM="Hemiselmis andersenii, Strain CCMP441" /LENGTH=190 /DNA_ID=CAMNT_0012755209 /DNA_START=134 /DNA_END=708 /DNA_ORIENTATION=+
MTKCPKRTRCRRHTLLRGGAAPSSRRTFRAQRDSDSGVHERLLVNRLEHMVKPSAPREVLCETRYRAYHVLGVYNGPKALMNHRAEPGEVLRGLPNKVRVQLDEVEQHVVPYHRFLALAQEVDDVPEPDRLVDLPLVCALDARVDGAPDRLLVAPHRPPVLRAADPDAQLPVAMALSVVTASLKVTASSS